MIYDRPLFRFSFQVRNSGLVSRQHTVQLYAGFCGGILEEPAYRLAGFAKTELLNPGEIQELTITINAERLTVYDDAQSAWVIQKGIIDFFMGLSVEDLSKITDFAVEESVVLKTTKNSGVSG